MNIKKIALIALISTTALTAVAADENYFVGLNTGYALGMKSGVTDSTLETNYTKTGKSALVGLEAGYKFNENFRTSVSFNYAPSFKASAAATTGYSTPKTKIKSMSVMLNGYYDIADFDGFTPYLTAGLGIARNKTSAISVTKNATTNPTVAAKEVATVAGKTTTSLAAQLGLGVKYAVSSAFDVSLGYQFQYLGKFAGTITGKNKAGNTVTYNTKGSLRANTILVGVAYKF